MLTLNDGRNELWQWDTGRKLTVDADCSQVHFSNKVFGRSIDVDVVDGTVAIPDVLLQVDNELIAWAFVGTPENGYTKISKVFKVNKRNKPANYVFTPTEQTTLGQIMERLDDLEAMQDPDAIKNVVDDYLANNPIQIDEKDPTVSAWAKQATKPKYTATEVGAVATVNGVKPDANGNVEITIQGSGGNVDYVGVEPAYDDIPKVFFGGALQQTKDEAVVPFRYISKTDDFSGYAEIKAQGNSSMSYPKKNQTVKMFADEACDTKMKKDFRGWGKQNKHVYKANWIDLTHARNVVSARLWADVVKSRANYEELPELLRTTPNQGAVDGFPIKLFAAGVYQGRYTLNIPKDKWTFNMDDKLDEHCVLCGENYVSGCFRALAQINESDWTDEIHDVVPASIKTRWNQVISFVMNSTDDEFQANLSQYFYVDSLIDYYLFGLASCGLDAFGKNQIYATYDGQRWIASMYDMDSTWGLYWNGSKFVATDYARTSYEDYVHTSGNLLYNRLEQLFSAELQTRWEELKNGALSITNIINRFERFTDIAPAELVAEDYASTTGGGKFTGIPSKSTNNIQQIRSFALARQAWTDSYVEGLTPAIPVPCEGITLDKNTLTFTGEGTQTITATVVPDGCTDNVIWVSSRPDIASIFVDGNVCTVEAIANGSATITATCGEYSASCTVAVSGIAEPVPCTGITLDKTSLTFNGGGTQTIVATVTPTDTTDKIVWSSDNASVARVENGVVTAVQNGSATITATCGTQTASCTVEVSGMAVAPVYSLPEATTFNGTSDYIDTGIKLFDTAKDFTIILTADLSQENASSATVFHCMYEVRPWPGLNMQVETGGTYQVSGNTGANSRFAPGIPNVDNVIVAIVFQNGLPVSIKYADGWVVEDARLPSDATYTQVNQNLLIGAYQTASGTKGRFWKGTLYDFRVWDVALSDEEVLALIPEQKGVLYPLVNGVKEFTDANAESTLTITNGNHVRWETNASNTANAVAVFANLSNLTLNSDTANSKNNFNTTTALFELKAGDVVEYNVINPTNNKISYNGAKKMACNLVTVDGVELKMGDDFAPDINVIRTYTVTSDVSIGCLNMWFGSHIIPDKWVEFTVELYVNGVRYV